MLKMCELTSGILHCLALHYYDVIMGAQVSQITSLAIVYSTVYSGAYQRKHQSSASLAFVRGIYRGPVNSTQKWPVTRKMFPFDDVIMFVSHLRTGCRNTSISDIGSIFSSRKGEVPGFDMRQDPFFNASEQKHQCISVQRVTLNLTLRIRCHFILYILFCTCYSCFTRHGTRNILIYNHISLWSLFNIFKRKAKA